MRVTFDGAPKSGTPGILLGFVDSDDARALNQLPAAERLAQEMESYVRYFGPKTGDARSVFDYA